MKEFVVTFETRVSYMARNDEQAEERANQLEEWLRIELVLPDKRKRSWLGDLESERGSFIEEA